MRAVTRQVLLPGRRLRPERAQRHMGRSLPGSLVLGLADVAAMPEGATRDRVGRWADAYAAARGWKSYRLHTYWSPDGQEMTVTIQPNRETSL